jgi:hypothetical protein
MRLLTISYFLSSYLTLAIADVQFSSPAAGDTIEAGSTTATFDINWTEGGNSPSLADASSYVLVLMTGSNDKPVSSLRPQIRLSY